jgi:lathosterol oxidase
MKRSDLFPVIGSIATTAVFYGVFAALLRAHSQFLRSQTGGESVDARLLFLAQRAGWNILIALVGAVAIYLVYRILRLTVWFRNRRIADRAATPSQLAREFVLGANLTLAAGLQAAAYTILTEMGYSRIYPSISERGWAYAAASVAGYLVFNDTWFYFAHRWYHDNTFIYEKFHHVHHLSVITTPLTTNQISPFELLPAGLMGILIVAVLPIAAPVLFGLVVFLTLHQMLLHSGFELFPEGTASHPLGKWLVTPTYHQMHHELFGKNMGLYFNWWDRRLGTFSPDYEGRFRSVTQSQKALG